MRQIRVLPPLVANQIAAGEVVERPASVVKELLDNALDAGATRILVELQTGGIELVRVTDDGHGIPPEQLPLALHPHATSKINSAEDLAKIATMGFRGEALASISSVSRLALRSRTPAYPGASLIEAEGDVTQPTAPAPGPVGTSVTVRNLFFNTPVRRKFLRTPNTEQGKCLDVVRELAMAHPALGFTLVCDGKTAIDVPAEQTPRERVVAILGKELQSQLFEISSEDAGRSAAPVVAKPGLTVAPFGEAMGPISLWGMAGLPSLARATTQAQHVFVNGRPIRDKTIQHAIKEAYRGLIEPGRHPTAVLMIEMNPAEVDVNVHPAKAEVRFRDSSRIHSLVLRSIREVLQRADLTPTIRTFAPPSGFGGRAILPGAEAAGGPPPTPPGDLSAGPMVPRAAPNASGQGSSNAQAPAGFVDYFKRQIPAQSGGRISFDAIREAVEASPPPVVPAGAPASEEWRAPQSAVSPVPIPEHAATLPAQDVPAEPSLLSAVPAKRAIQIHNAYLVTQDEFGVVIIDQHALHERVMFEKLLARIGRGESLESQHLLTPMVVPASPSQVDRLDDLRVLLSRIGVVATAFGPATIAVSAFPTFLFERGVEPGPFLGELFEKAEASGFVPGSEETLSDVLDMMACKAAIKAGNHLSESELAELLDLRQQVERSSNCPHGRPTSIRMTIAELERRFGRS